MAEARARLHVSLLSEVAICKSFDGVHLIAVQVEKFDETKKESDGEQRSDRSIRAMKSELREHVVDLYRQYGL